MCVAHKSVSLLRCGTVVRKTSGNALQAGRLVCAHQVSFITSAASIHYLWVYPITCTIICISLELEMSDLVSTSNVLLSSFLAVSLGVSLEGDLGPPWVWAGAGYLFIWPHCGCLGGARYGRECGLLLQEGLGLAAVFKPFINLVNAGCWRGECEWGMRTYVFTLNVGYLRGYKLYSK